MRNSSLVEQRVRHTLSYAAESHVSHVVFFVLEDRKVLTPLLPLVQKNSLTLSPTRTTTTTTTTTPISSKKKRLSKEQKFTPTPRRVGGEITLLRLLYLLRWAPYPVGLVSDDRFVRGDLFRCLFEVAVCVIRTQGPVDPELPVTAQSQH